MLGKLIRALWRIKNREKIPPLPWGMLASNYDAVDRSERRAMARMGIRSPSGLKLALKRAKVKNIDELIATLEHHRPKRNIGQRLRHMISRLVLSKDYDPHRKEIIRIAKQSPTDREMQNRVKDISRRFQHDQQN